MEFIRKIFDLYRYWQFEVSDTSLYYIAALFSVYYLCRKTEERIKQSFLYPCIFTFFVLFNPITEWILCTYIKEFSNRFQRVYWLIPYTILIAVAVIYIYNSLKERDKRWILAAFLICVTVLSSANKDAIYRTENIYKVQDTLIEVSEYFEKLPKKDVYIFYDNKDLYLTSRQYTGSIKVPDWYQQSMLMSALENVYNGGEISDEFTTLLKQSGIEYMVVQNSLSTFKIEQFFEYETKLSKGYIYRVL